MKSRQQGTYQPPTLEQRGTAVPFTTPSLALSRVRSDDRHSLVLVLSSFGGGEGAYVVPWKAVPDLGPMSVHDRALHEEIYEMRAVTPAAVRRCSLKSAATGLAGPEAAVAARHAIELEVRRTTESHYIIIVSLLMALGIDVSPLVESDPATGAWRARAGALLEEAGKQIGMPAEQFYARSSALARLLEPVGFRQAAEGSRARTLLGELAVFRESIVGWGMAERSVLGSSARVAGETAGRTAEIAGRVLDQFDRRTADGYWVLRDWQREAMVVAAMSNRVAWLLDGWDHIAALWQRAQAEDVAAQRESVVQILPALPVIPQSEAGDGEISPVPHLVGMPQPSRADLDMIARLEAAKANAARI